ncbi:MmgE/PrpD family protein, partial [Phreatobacter sp. AB_2022a]|uniref:MmgE/PrpD family protein n=1 Tax=Phreatobacter sp. AB_2022a TaxID=3003134 RepID=UPI00229ED969|nr:MmgE/PrpD family protein [Phreatobacter sp. AB_2022a]
GGQRSVLGTTAKPAGCGLAARAGLEAALLARSGIDAPADAIEEPRGFAALANGGHCDPAGLDGLGSRFALIAPGFAFKAYPACSAAQAAVEATLMLRAAHGLRPDAVAAVRCEVTPLVAASLTFDRPETPTEAQFSLPYAVARALVDGRFDMASLAPDALADAAVRRLMPAIGMVASDALARCPADLVHHPEAAVVTIDTHDGRRLTQAVPAATGMPANPMPDKMLDAKFRANATPAIGRAAAEALLGRLRGIDGLAQAAGLLTEGVAA